MNKFLERISLLTEQDLIKWKKTSSNIRKYTIRFVGVGIKHKFVYIKSAKQRCRILQ